MAVVLECLIGGGIERILNMHTETGVLDEMRVGEQLGPLTVGITHLE